jgi:uncharacterized membrane protein YccF (DUF307 family)
MSQMNFTVNKNPGCLIQLIWFLLIGWWFGAIWVSIAWFLMATVIGIPFGIMMINRISNVIALRVPPQEIQVTTVGGTTRISERPQFNFIIRVIWFFVAGLWLSAGWMTVAYGLCVTIILMPFGFWMFDKTPTVLTLRQ